MVARLEGISKQYGDVRALENVDFAVKAGELVALLGPNGAGKSTAIKLLLGLAKPTSGQVTVFGGNPLEPAVRMRIGAMLQVAKVPETLRVAEHIDLFASYYPRPLPLAESLAIAGPRGYQGSRLWRSFGRPETTSPFCAGVVRRPGRSVSR